MSYSICTWKRSKLFAIESVSWLRASSGASAEGLNEAVDEALKKKKWIGCTRKWHYIIAVVCLVIGLVSFFLAGIVNALFVVAIIFWLASIVGCVGCCCMLKKDKYEDDGVTCSDTGDACMCWFCEP